VPAADSPAPVVGEPLADGDPLVDGDPPADLPPARPVAAGAASSDVPPEFAEHPANVRATRQATPAVGIRRLLIA